MPLTENLAIDLTWRKCCHHDTDFNFIQTCFNLADNKDRHEISVKFDFGLNEVVHSGVTCP